MRRIANVKLAAVLVVIVAVALVLPAGLSGPVLAEIPPDCRFWGPVTVCGTRIDAGTEITVSLDPDPLVGPSWTTTVFLWGKGEVPYYIVDIPPDDPSIPEPGGVEGAAVYFTVTGVTYKGSVFGANLSGPEGIWRMGRSVYHPLRVGTAGDVNLDGVVNHQDLSDLSTMIPNPSLRTPCADVNKDGKVNALDWALLWTWLQP